MSKTTRILAALAIVAASAASAAAQGLADSTPPSSDRPVITRASIERAVSAQTLTKAEWQRQYDLAMDRKNSGKKKLLYGIIGEAAGLVMIYAGVGSCDFYGDCSGSTALTALGALAALGGGGLAIWGYVEYGDARGDMESLERRQPTGSLQGHAAAPLRVSLGRRSAVTYRVSW